MTRVLIAEDDEIMRAMLKAMLEADGYAVLEAGDGLQAWEILDKQGADLLVSDVNMPGMDGFALVRKARGDRRFKKIPIIMLTIRGEAESQVKGYNVGADEYIPKPFEVAVFMSRLKAVERRAAKP
ncbi:MAG: response regulator [Elusimicrobiales bacterium]|nr:response regulator [Elusimicrobiales bacterium]